MRWKDFLEGPLYILIADAVLVLVLIGVVNLLVPDTLATVSLGYSMCQYRTPYADFTSMNNHHCSIIPGDVLLISRVPPDVNDIACVSARVGIICHRAYKVDKDGVCIIGDAAKWTACYPWSSYVGRVLGKLPRSVSMPGAFVWGLAHGYPNIFTLIDEGSYAPAHSA